MANQTTKSRARLSRSAYVRFPVFTARTGLIVGQQRVDLSHLEFGHWMTTVARNGYWRERNRCHNVAVAAFGDEVRMLSVALGSAFCSDLNMR